MMPKIHVYAVVRIDTDGTPAPGSGDHGFEMARFREVTIRGITVVTVLPTIEEAEREVERLNTLNAAKSATYFWMTTRYYPQGRGIAPPDES
jgi:hypothetical protein